MNEPNAVAKHEAFRFLAASDLPVRPIDWLLTDFLEQNSLAVLYGGSNKDKSLLALDLSGCLATNTPFHGQAVRQSAVFFITSEGLSSIARRLRAWSAHNGVNLKDAPLFISSHPADMGIEAHISGVASAITQLSEATGHAPALIVVDNLLRNFSGDENSPADISHFVRLADLLISRLNVAVLVIHSGHSSSRGLSALKDAVDGEYELSRSADNRLCTLSARKIKNAPEPAPLTFEPIDFLENR